jgi:hypothetical protein
VVASAVFWTAQGQPWPPPKPANPELNAHIHLALFKSKDSFGIVSRVRAREGGCMFDLTCPRVNVCLFFCSFSSQVSRRLLPLQLEWSLRALVQHWPLITRTPSDYTAAASATLAATTPAAAAVAAGAALAAVVARARPHLGITHVQIGVDKLDGGGSCGVAATAHGGTLQRACFGKGRRLVSAFPSSIRRCIVL